MEKYNLPNINTDLHKLSSRSTFIADEFEILLIWLSSCRGGNM